MTIRIVLHFTCVLSSLSPEHSTVWDAMITFMSLSFVAFREDKKGVAVALMQVGLSALIRESLGGFSLMLCFDMGELGFEFRYCVISLC